MGSSLLLPFISFFLSSPSFSGFVFRYFLHWNLWKQKMKEDELRAARMANDEEVQRQIREEKEARLEEAKLGQLGRIIGTKHRKMMREALRIYFEGMREKDRVRHILHHAALRIIKRSMVKCYAVWKAVYAEKRRTRVLLERAARKISQRCVFSCLLRWKELVAERTYVDK